MSQSKSYSLLRGLAEGLVAGGIATLAMNLAFRGAKLATGKDPLKPAGNSKPATAKAAHKLAQNVAHTDFPDSYDAMAGGAMHWGMGLSMGALYGALASRFGGPKLGTSLVWGLGIWLIADEIVVPMLGLQPKPKHTPFSAHAIGLGAHLVYGATIGLSEKGIDYALA